MSAAEYARRSAAETKDAWPVTRKVALDNAIRQRGRELGMSHDQINNVADKARKHADKVWGR